MGSPRDAIALAWTGASGAPYGLRLLHCLLAAGEEVFLMVSPAARVVLAAEEDLALPAEGGAMAAALGARLGVATDGLRILGHQEWMAPVASGSAAPRAMVVCPCSMGTLSAIATGASNNLIERAADVMLKERRPLILVPRDTPLSAIHLENMLRVTRAGAVVLPASPGFYHRPRTVAEVVDFVVARILDHLGIGHDLIPRWGA
ncbi:flavin prenyltransferase UbiX [Inmirania thermothiophila]|uniref:Flavin prenyltransferase UbiX n=1 Tax=Inmirania thermothiophila TaxID=1750597 RepID=A0A3N1Y7Q7_9GAMM|nr:flavin prenyltransferase UbiX [Inmirania thermothiophila]ROR34790.1 4-hydroxy-3-polyprenylbenzoate decarboxylase [Inmirania thermothiophila]